MICLKNDNLSEWKAELDRRMKLYAGMEKYSESLTDEEWLRDYKGTSAEEVADEELSLFGSDG